MRLHVDVVAWRGTIAESRHRVEFALCAPDGSLEAASEEPDRVTTLRSSAKPLQLVPLIERGHAERLGLSDPELAVLAASHNGSPWHAAQVRGVLERIGCADGDLRCGYHEPADPIARARLAQHPEERTPIWNNCSGNHAGMLCLARSEGWPIEGYEQPEHPIQKLMHRTMAELCGLDQTQVMVAVDGCSVSVFGLPLAAMARGYARLAAARPEGEARERALATIRNAMATNPVAVGGDGRLGTTIMKTTHGRIVVKGGAEGLQCVALSARGLGLAIKVEDGSARATGPATIALLDHLGELSPDELMALESHRRPQLVNLTGRHVGRIEAVVRVPAGTTT